MKSAIWFKAGGALIGVFGLIYAYLELQRWISGLEFSFLNLTIGLVMIGAGASLLDAGRLKSAREWIAGEVIAAWVLFTLALVSAVAIGVGSTIGDPRMKIAWVFSAAFALIGGTLYYFGRKSKRPGARVLKSAAQAQDDKDMALVGHLDWRSGTLVQDHAQRPRRIWPGGLALAVGLPMLGLTAAGLYGFGAFGAIFTGIGLFLLYRRWAGRQRMSTFGISVLNLEEYPILLKNGVNARLIIPVSPMADRVTAHLSCVRRRRVPAKRSRGKVIREAYDTFDTLYESEQLIDLTGENPGTCDISFRPPLDLPAAIHVAITVVWKLVVTADNPGMDYRAEFRLPVRA